MDETNYSSPSDYTNNSKATPREQFECEKDDVTDDDTNWKSVLYDFCQNTTIHGLRQITEPTPYCIRRIIWILILTAGMVAFGKQMIDSILYYRSWPVAVNVRINYNDTLTFPAITICNQNTFRATVTAEHGHYDLISNLFSHHGANDQDHVIHHHDHLEGYNITLEELYTGAAHQQQDMIVGCTWDKKPCDDSDFLPVLTDHGLCFTFNSGRNKPARNASQTGADRGLRLKLNIEQYEYMQGPNDGAGLKILVYDQADVPLIRDLGQAIPPGSHAFVGIQIIQVHNLKPPHGKCDDSRSLTYFGDYTISTCHLDCKEDFVVKECGCRDYYMPELSPGVPPVCNLYQYVDCMLPALEAFNDQRENCPCPIPCNRMMFDPIITYASNSNFDMDVMLRGDTGHLQDSYVKARETTQRVNRAIVASDRNLIRSFTEAVGQLDVTFYHILSTLTAVLEETDSGYSIMQKRVHFHSHRSLHGIKFTVEHDFIRGWEVMDERTLSLVTLSYLEFVHLVERFVEQATVSGQVQQAASPNATMDSQDVRALWVMVETQLLNRVDLCNRAQDNLTEIHTAYNTGVPLLTYKYTKDRRYDVEFISLPLLQENDGNEEEYYYPLQQYGVTQMKTTLLRLRQEISKLVDTDAANASATFNASAVTYLLDRFRFSCRTYNYRYFQYKDRIVQAPLVAIDTRIETFESVNATLSGHYKTLKILALNVYDLITNMNISAWQDIRNMSVALNDYLTDPSIGKSDIAAMFNANQMQSTFPRMQHFFTTLRARARELADAWSRLATSYSLAYSNMLNEYTTVTFYNRVHEDMADYVANINDTETADFYLHHFKYLMRIKWAEIRPMSVQELYIGLNADFPVMNWFHKSMEIHRFFNRARAQTDIAAVIGDKDDKYLRAATEVQTELSEFQDGNKIDFEFYRQNFMHLDIFMRELSYEEIEQQIAYDMTNLWSDLGGSIGLFIGASALSVFEVLDVFIYNSFKIHHHGRRKKKPPKVKDADKDKKNGTHATGDEPAKTWLTEV